jgi:transcriptional regulator with XRE-family HTH domain
MQLGVLLRELRGPRRAQDVARDLGVVRSAVYLWESTTPARRLPSATSLQRLLDLYGATDEQRLLAWRLRSQAETAVEHGTAA